uniref:Uncharacterized protein n=1 Tax=Medicago truncatula TaxID=3880 RepID=Q2HW68_MEDTR|nr:hypothetical protein MtrDRAFT_AC147961g22v2 [Medicago truncatula]ABN07984.1 hypothetical protein MtrDRAFT_AC153128g27v2 [Medicago truncatula]
MKLRNEDDMMIMFSIFDSTVRKYESNKTLSWRDIFMISGELSNTREIILKYMIEVKLKDKGERGIRTIRGGEGESEFH